MPYILYTVFNSLACSVDHVWYSPIRLWKSLIVLLARRTIEFTRDENDLTAGDYNAD